MRRAPASARRPVDRRRYVQIAIVAMRPWGFRARDYESLLSSAVRSPGRLSTWNHTALAGDTEEAGAFSILLSGIGPAVSICPTRREDAASMSADPAATNDDVRTLHAMGYAQELARRMSGFSNYAI